MRHERLDELFERGTLPEGFVEEPGAGHGSRVAVRGVYPRGRFYSQELEELFAGFVYARLEIILEHEEEVLRRK
jgi:hypothetical protein